MKGHCLLVLLRELVISFIFFLIPGMSGVAVALMLGAFILRQGSR